MKTKFVFLGALALMCAWSSGTEWPPQKPFDVRVTGGPKDWPGHGGHPAVPATVAGDPSGYPPQRPTKAGPFDPQEPEDGTGHGNPRLC